MIDLRAHIRAGDGVWWGQAAAEATPLVDAFLDQLGDLGACRAFCGLSWNPRLASPPGGLSLISYGAMGTLRKAAAGDRLAVVPGHYSTLPRLFAEGLLPHDVALVQVSPPGADGRCGLGFGTDYTVDALRHTKTVIAEINTRMPACTATGSIAQERFTATVETDRDLPALPGREPDDVDRAIAAHVAGLIDDGATLQVGVGTLPDAILDALTGHQDLGVHSGMITDGVLRLLDKGVITGRRKEIDPGSVVAGMAIGGENLYSALPHRPIEFRPASYTHDPAVLARLRGLVAINSALQVDLTGQVGSEAVGRRYIGGLGGQADFSGAAARSGARSIIALRASAGDHSAIVTRLGGPVTTARADVDAVVTEHGVAHLRGCPLPERAARLAAIAAVEHRDELLRAAWEGDR